MYNKLSRLTVILTFLFSLTSNIAALELSKSSLTMPAIISFLLTSEDNTSSFKAYKIFGITNYNPDDYNNDDDYEYRYIIHTNYTLLGEFNDVELKNIDISIYNGFAVFIYDNTFKIDLLNLDSSNIYTTQEQPITLGNIDIDYTDFLGEFHTQDDDKVAIPKDYVSSDNVAVLVFTTYGTKTLNIKLVQ